MLESIQTQASQVCVCKMLSAPSIRDRHLHDSYGIFSLLRRLFMVGATQTSGELAYFSVVHKMKSDNYSLRAEAILASQSH